MTIFKKSSIKSFDDLIYKIDNKSILLPTVTFDVPSKYSINNIIEGEILNGKLIENKEFS